MVGQLWRDGRKKGAREGPQISAFDDELDMGVGFKVTIKSDIDHGVGKMPSPGWGGSEKGQDGAERGGAPFAR